MTTYDPTDTSADPAYLAAMERCDALLVARFGLGWRDLEDGCWLDYYADADGDPAEMVDMYVEWADRYGDLSW